MALTRTRSATSVARALGARLAACCLAAIAMISADARAQEPEEALPEPRQASEPALAAPLSPVLDPEAAEFDPWQPLVECDPLLREDAMGGPMAEPFSSFDEADAQSELEPEIDSYDEAPHRWFRHSSTDGPFQSRNVPMQYTSWLNRPYHIDGFVGPLLSDGPVSGRVEQSNELFTGFRVGWDFDYYWGLEWRYGRADPMLLAAVPNPNDTGDEDDEPATTIDEFRGTYTVSDISFLYYPWGDTKVRPYVQWGLGITQIDSVRADGTGQESTLLGMPLGVGVQFPLTHWLAWRMEVVDNLAFSGDGIDAMNNFAFTAGMDVRLGARPNSYWPWRSSRTIW